MDSDKRDKIKSSLIATRERRKSQTCKVFELKIDISHLSNEKLKYLNSLFLEAKWFYNFVLSQDDVFKVDTKIKTITTLDKDKCVISKNLTVISSQMKQGLVSRIHNSINALSVLKSKKRIVGKLKFKSQVNSIPLKQFGVTYKFTDHNYVKIQGFRKPFRFCGKQQLPSNVEFANANLIRKNGNYYIKVTCFIPKEEKQLTNNYVGLDFGIKDSVTISDGRKFKFNFPETKRIKRISRKFNKSKYGSHNRWKLRLQLQKAYNKLSNVKKDNISKFISKLTSNNDLICIQNESIHAWHSSKMKGFGRRIQHSIMGGIISGLKKHPETLIIDKFFPSTKLCPLCGTLNSSRLEIRTYVCECGYTSDRDIHSSNNILIEGINRLIPTGRRDFKPVEKTLDLDSLIQFKASKQFSMKQEATML